MGLTWLTAVLLALPRNWIQARLYCSTDLNIYQYSIYFTLTSLTTQIHLPIGNKVDGFFFWCIPNYQDQVKKILSLINCSSSSGSLENIPTLHDDHRPNHPEHHHDCGLLLHLQEAPQSYEYRAETQQVTGSFIDLHN